MINPKNLLSYMIRDERRINEEVGGCSDHVGSNIFRRTCHVGFGIDDWLEWNLAYCLHKAKTFGRTIVLSSRARQQPQSSPE